MNVGLFIENVTRGNIRVLTSLNFSFRLLHAANAAPCTVFVGERLRINYESHCTSRPCEANQRELVPGLSAWLSCKAAIIMAPRLRVRYITRITANMMKQRRESTPYLRGERPATETMRMIIERASNLKKEKKKRKRKWPQDNFTTS